LSHRDVAELGADIKGYIKIYIGKLKPFVLTSYKK
jgi:hypothetical protein